VLKEGVSHEARDDFEREVETMSAFDHDNILKLLGTVSTGEFSFGAYPLIIMHDYNCMNGHSYRLLNHPKLEFS
jgi:serine/threonine protein kinase